MVSHLLTFGYAAMACGFVYFGATIIFLNKKQKYSNILSMVVMASAFFILKDQALNWQQSFQYSNGMWTPSNSMNFSNAYRYLNWLIDVPVLLTMLLFGLNQQDKPNFKRRWIIFTVSGVLMILTGYYGQFYQLENQGVFNTWGAISTVFYIVIIWLAAYCIFDAAKELPKDVTRMTKNIFWMFLIFWTLYPIAYGIPMFRPDAWGVVMKQGLFTVADVGSKVIYGIVLTYIGMKLSSQERQEPVRKFLKTSQV